MDKGIIKNVSYAGGNDFVDSDVALELIERGYDMAVLDMSSTKICGNK